MSTASSATRAQISQTTMDDEQTRKIMLMEALKEEDEIETKETGNSGRSATATIPTPIKNRDNDINTNSNPGTGGTTPPSPQPVQVPEQPGHVTAVGVGEKPKNKFKTKIAGRTVSGTGGGGGGSGGVQAHQQAVVQPAGTTTTPGGQVKYTKPKYRIEGSNIGSVAREPEWTTERLQLIAKLSSMRISTLVMTETRRSHPDPEGKYVGITQTGSISAKAPSWLGNIPWNEFVIGMGRPKPDEKTGKGKSYSDIVMKGKNWVLNQWTMADVVMEHVPDNILEKPPRMQNGRAERRIGHDFVRIGIPKTKAAPVLETIRSGIPAVMSNVSVTNGYYWTNASWGVTGNPGKFVYKDANGVIQETFKAYDAMKMLNGMSSMGVATIAISIGSNTKMQDGKMVPVPNEEEFSIKIHNMLHLNKVPYSSPPQSAANGFDVTDDIYASAETLSMPSGMSSMFLATAPAFSDQSMNPFVNSSSSVTNNTAGGQNNTKLLF